MENEIKLFIEQLIQKDNFSLHNNKIVDAFKDKINNSKNKDDYIILFFNIIKAVQDVEFKIFLLSVLLYIAPRVEFIDFLIKFVMDIDIPKEKKYFLVYQAFYRIFLDNSLKGKKTYNLLFKLYKHTYNLYKRQISQYVDMSYIPKKQRNKKQIFVLTNQFISINHAPSRRALVKCINLDDLGYDVVLINSCNLASEKDAVLFYNGFVGNVSERFFDLSVMDIYDKSFPFIQLKDMSNSSEIIMLLEAIREKKPYLILEIGATNIIADLCNEIVPVVSISASEGLPISLSSFRVASAPVDKEDINILPKYGISKKSLLVHKLKFSMLSVSNDLYEKKDVVDFGIPKDKFVLLLVGARLTTELTDQFLKTLLKLVKHNIHIVIVGKYTKYDDSIKNIKLFKDNVTYLGSQWQMAPVYQSCDLYVNPKRQGGGASSVEALYFGLPVVTLKHGDVYNNVGKKFAVNSIKDMIKMIKRYAKDKKYYNSMSIKAKKRAKKLIDSPKDTKKLLDKVLTNTLFK